MKKLFLLFISSVFILSACGNKYEKEIEEVTKLEKKDDLESKTKDKSDRVFDRKNSDFKVYEDGNVVIVSQKPFTDSDVITDTPYIKNQTTGEFEYSSDIKVKKYQQDNKPEYEEKNMKK
ncbi:MULTISPECIES: cystatin-like fold lipoprotein [Staphylococcus]|uniref:DUF4467 domain-containing protein n=1 Tax=Staphylococcus agnetis TaxID=985762 RepID=A0ABX3Z3I1_9STAP|nr:MULTISPECIES: cystatin-like fold lipoprotein [Staphylococcus]EZU81766.1 hypothetical protein U995_02336 [Staphylococcus aureus 1111203374]OSP20267.1 hypothetical protein B9L42_06460 [Staphylococcus agnetis]OSP23007.1 hypothetical protein B9M87_10035 [Staphylococcus agnetis]OTW31478.1 hypothetical protein B9M88_04660 [Staphylococcus agnetis]